MKKYTIDKKIGYKNERGQIIVEPKYDIGIPDFGSDYYKKTKYGIVSISDKYGAINECGDVVIPIEYHEVVYLFDELFAVRKNYDNGDYVIGVLNTNLEIIIPFEYKYIKADNPYIACYKSATVVERYRDDSYEFNYGNGYLYKYSSLSDEVWCNNTGGIIFSGAARGACGAFLAIETNDKVSLVRNDGEIILSEKYNDIIYLFGDYFAAKIDTNKDDWNFGVIDSNDNCIIDFSQKYIEGFESGIFRCFDITCSDDFGEHKTYHKDFRNKKESIKIKDERWLNLNNIIIHEGEGKPLVCNLLATKKYNKWGVINNKGEKIVNYNYDDISSINDYVIVKKDSCIGLVANNGQLLIDPVYKKIRCINVKDSSCNKIQSSSNDTYHRYYSYSKQYIFDTNTPDINRDYSYFPSKTTLIIDSEINLTYQGITIWCQQVFDPSKYFILTTDDYSEIFSFEEGIIHNSRYDDIKQITNISFVVKRNGLYGVFRVDETLEIIPCEYDRIQFEGKHTVLLCKDGKWGAKTLIMPSHKLYPLLNVNIPTEYLEIKILDTNELIYGVKKEYENWKKEIKAKYIILLGINGESYAKTGDFSIQFESQFTEYNTDKILTSNNGKYGFISSKGYVSIPFKYDEVIERTDSDFDVRIDNRWGVLSLSGKELVPLKYSEKLSEYFNFSIVQDSITGCFGVIDGSGLELVPSIYEHLMIEGNYIFFGFNGYNGGEGNFFSNIDYAIWGCMNKQGQILIPPKYDCYKLHEYYILAGRDGHMISYNLTCSESNFGSEYSGVYDLYTTDGELIIGGFSDYSFGDQILLYFGGQWESYITYNDDWNNITIYDYKFTRKNGGWLILDSDLNSLVFDDDGNPYQLKKGQIVTLTEKKDDNDKITNVYRNIPVPLINIPEEDNMPIIEDGYIYEGRKYFKSIRRLSDNVISDNYSDIKLINNGIFFATKEGKVGIITVDQIVLDVNYFAVTIPVNGYVFAALQKENYKFNIELINIDNENFDKITIFTDIERNEVDSLYYYDNLRLIQVSNNGNLNDYAVKDINMCDVSKTIFSKIQEFPHINSSEKEYWFSVLDLSPSHGRNEDYYQDDDDTDWRRDKWDAMTDGMYGDYPDGFDDDYDRFGF